MVTMAVSSRLAAGAFKALNNDIQIVIGNLLANRISYIKTIYKPYLDKEWYSAYLNFVGDLTGDFCKINANHE